MEVKLYSADEALGMMDAIIGDDDEASFDEVYDADPATWGGSVDADADLADEPYRTDEDIESEVNLLFEAAERHCK